ncbi:chmp1 [Symbiodinium sp. KB8]|nr:chmp1 [Symbiodinium sp. KB8]
MEGAKIHAANAIREKNMSLQYLRLSSRVESVSSRVDTAVRMNTITKTMGKVVTGMSHVMKSMDPEKITAVMENFEKQFEDMDVRSAYMEGSMATATASATPEQDVNSLINQVAEENQLELNEEFREAGIVGSTVPTQTGMLRVVFLPSSRH